MDKSLLTKLVWLGAIAAIPVAVLALQKPTVTLPAETRRVMTVDKPVAVDISAAEVQGPKPLETAKPLEPAPKPKTMWVGGGKITSKIGTAAQGEAAPAPAPAAAATPAPAAAPAAGKDDRSAIPAKDPSKLTASVAPSAGPRAQ